MINDKAELLLLGLGVDPEKHATIEVLQALGTCDAACVEGADPRFVKRYAPKARLVKDPRKALAAGQRVALVTLGHPFYWSATAGKLLAEGWKWRTFGAVSPMGVAISDLGVTLGVTIYGLQAFDYAAAAAREVVINRSWPLVLYFCAKPAAPAKLDGYPPSHPVFLCRGDNRPRELTLSEVPKLLKKLGPGDVLYLPALEEPKSRVGRTEWDTSSDGRKEAPAWVRE